MCVRVDEWHRLSFLGSAEVQKSLRRGVGVKLLRPVGSERESEREINEERGREREREREMGDTGEL